MDEFLVSSRYLIARVQESVTTDGYSSPEHNQCLLEVLYMAATFCLVLCWHTDSNMLTKHIICIALKKIVENILSLNWRQSLLQFSATNI